MRSSTLSVTVASTTTTLAIVACVVAGIGIGPPVVVNALLPQCRVIHRRSSTTANEDGTFAPSHHAMARVVVTTRIDYKNAADDDDYVYRDDGGDDRNYYHHLESEIHGGTYRGSDVDGDGDRADDDDGLSLLAKLKDQNDQFVEYRRAAMMDAMRDATRRTSPMDAIYRRMEEGRLDREGRERTRLERACADLIGGVMMPLGGGGIVGGRDDDESPSAMAHREHDGDGRDDARAGGGIPVLDVLSRPPVYESPPLLVGGTLMIMYSDLTPSQRRALEIASAIHREDCSSSSSSSSLEEGGMGGALDASCPEGRSAAAPIIAIIDGYTARRHNERGGRYATLASIEMIEGGGGGCGDDIDRHRGGGGGPWAIRLVGVGRALLRDYFLSSDGRRQTEEEGALAIILSRIREFDNGGTDDEEDDLEDLGQDDYDDDDSLQVIMADFDVLLDDHTVPSSDVSGGGSSSAVHAIAELYRAANRVYRLHEERKRLVAGLRAGAARLRSSKERLAYLTEFEDCDGLGLVGRSSLVDVVNDPGWTTPSAANAAPWGGIIDDIPIRTELEAMENFGLGSYGILSTIPDLTRELVSQLEPYYSPVHREREEYEAEVASMVVLKTLEEYATPDELASGLLAPSATRRLELGFEVMMRHKEKLHEL
ncbi:hypothetical protein ACHAXA_009881, partial [Cyclostephanos tholiformis]